ncbi:MAG: Succinate-semialdehyde dehydrogenase [NAD(P)+], partial [uncultured Solirubrobacteraceae bacterium]
GDEPRHGRGHRGRAADGRGGDAPRHRGRRAGAPGLAGDAREGARGDPAPLGRPDAGPPGGALRPAHLRAGQAARRVAGGGGVRRELPRVVRGGGQAGLRRHDPDVRARPPDHRHEGARGGDRGHHAVELPRRDADQEGGARARGRL